MLEEYQGQGYKIVLMSGAYEFIIQEVADYFGADAHHASKLEKIDGSYTGKFEKDILLSKKELLKKEFPEIETLVVVSDNKSDADLLLLADKAYAVCNKEKDCIFWKNYPQFELIKDY